MASVTPAVKGTPGWVPQGSMYASHASNTPDTLVSGRVIRTAGLRHQVWYFHNLPNGAVWRTPPAGVVAAAVKQNTNDHAVDATSVGLNANRQAILGIIGETVFSSWLHTWSRGGKVRVAGTDTSPVRTPATAGYVNPWRNHWSQTPGYTITSDDTIESGRPINGLGLKHSVFYFTNFAADDEWIRSSTASQILDVAWQSRVVDISSTDQVMPYIKANGRDIFFFGNGAGLDGWLHLWTRG